MPGFVRWFLLEVPGFMKHTQNVSSLYRRPPEFTVTQPESRLADGLQPGHTVNITDVQYKFGRFWRKISHKDGCREVSGSAQYCLYD